MLFTEVNMPFILTLYLIHQCDILIQMIDGADFLEVLLTGRQRWCIEGMWMSSCLKEWVTVKEESISLTPSPLSIIDWKLLENQELVQLWGPQRLPSRVQNPLFSYTSEHGTVNVHQGQGMRVNFFRTVLAFRKLTCAAFLFYTGSKH